MEIWKKIEGFENYEVSSLGRIKSLNRKSSYNKKIHEKLLKGWVCSKGYSRVQIKNKIFGVHQLVAVAFLNHKINKYETVVNHINFIRNDNRFENLEVVSARENSNRKHLKSTSKFTGVSWNSRLKKWRGTIVVENKQINLGYFNSEIEASEYYENSLKSIKNKEEIKVKRIQAKGAYWEEKRKQWKVILTIKGVKKTFGYFKTQEEAINKIKEIKNEI